MRQLNPLLLVVAVLVVRFSMPDTFAGAAVGTSSTESKPQITHVATVAPDILGVTVESGHIEHAKQMPYQKQDGDVFDDPNKPHTVWVKRNGQTIGSLVGPKQDTLVGFDRLTGDSIDTAWADKPASYTITSRDDPRYAQGISPLQVHRKTKPTDMAQTGPWQFDWPLRHILYLRLPQPLQEGKTYTLRFNGGNLPAYEYLHRPMQQRSEAVHVSQIGFRPDDPAKVAFLSLWMGSGGPATYTAGTPFRVVDDATGKAVYEGKITLSKAGADKTEDPYNRNYSGTDVYMMDFSELRTPGRYRVNVEGIGGSYSFEVRDGVWRDAFQVSAKGLYFQRSGIPIGPPYSKFTRPRPFHPDDGVKVYHSTTPLMDSGNGLNARGTDKGNFENLVKGLTTEIVPNAWGGYFDAGDWDRRIQHLDATNLLFELAEMLPQYFTDIKLNIPESKDDLPDIINEALWTLDFFKRLQTGEGGVRGGIESAEHPRRGEGSWQESLTVMAYAPDMWCSYLYAGSAARAAHWLQTRKPQLAQGYRDSAIRAMNWAEKAYSTHDYEKLPHQVPDARNLAAAELFRITGETKWHEIFVQTTMFKDPQAALAVWEHHEQRDAAFVYARTDRPGMDATIKENTINSIVREADESLKWGDKTGFKWTKKNAWEPIGWGKFAVPQASTLVRAHYLTKEQKYLRGAVLASQTGLGANPANLSYTTGVGHDFPKHPLLIDQRVTGQAVPPGITVFGPMDMEQGGDHWMVKLFAPVTHPAPATWPSIEAYYDVFLFPETNEYVVGTIASNAYVWGYLAARARQEK
jgi:endoglucanase